MEPHYGASLWSLIMEPRYGASLWSLIMEPRLPEPIRNLCIHFKDVSQSVVIVVENHYSIFILQILWII